MNLKEQLEKEHGKGIIQQLGKVNPDKVKAIPTEIDLIDNKLFGCGGVPVGRQIEILGSESSGKTTLALAIIAAYQRQGHEALFIDAEQALDLNWAKLLGVDLEKLLVYQPEGTAEKIIELIITAVQTKGTSGIIVVDSVAALMTRSELEGDVGDANMGSTARLMGQAMRKITHFCGQSNWSVIWINQVRDKLGVMFGPNTTTPGGRALKFFASIRAEIARGQVIKHDQDVIGHEIKIKVVKNKVSAPYKEGAIPLYYASGLDNIGLEIDRMIESGEIEKKGAWFVLDGEKFQGRNALIDHLKSKGKV